MVRTDPEAALEKADNALEKFLRYLSNKNGATADSQRDDKGSPIPLDRWNFANYMRFLGENKKLTKPIGSAISKVHEARNPSRHGDEVPDTALATRSIAVVEYVMRSMTESSKQSPIEPPEGGTMKLPKLCRKVVPKDQLNEWLARDWYVARYRGRNPEIHHEPYKKWEKFEIKLRHLFKTLGFEDCIDDVEDFEFTDLGPQIDVCGGYEGTFFVIDCTSKSEPGTRSLKSKIDNVLSKRDRIIKNINKKYPSKYHSYVFSVCTEDVDISKTDREYAAECEVIMIDDIQVEKWFKYYRTLGLGLKYHIIKRLTRATPVILDQQADPFFRYPAFKLEEAGRTLYSFLADPSSLLQLAYVFRLDANDPKGYQRDLKRRKLLDINDFLAESGSFFANNLIMSFDTLSGNKKWPDFVPMSEDQNTGYSAGTLSIPKIYCSGEVIDGQHRLYGYLDATENQLYRRILAKRRKEDRIPVVAVVDPQENERAKLFTDINSNQTKVETKALWALIAEVRPFSPMGYAARVILELNKHKTFRYRIQIPRFAPAKKKLNIANIGKGILDRRLLNKEQEFTWNLYPGDRKSSDYRGASVALPAKQIGQFFAPFSTERDVRDFAFTNNGFNVLLRIFAEWLKYQQPLKAKLQTGAMGRKTLRALRVVLSKYKLKDLKRRTSNEAERASIATEIMTVIRKSPEMEGFAIEIIRRTRKRATKETISS